MSRSADSEERGPRLPPWVWLATVTGGVFTYALVGTVLLGGPQFEQGIADLWRDPGAFASGGAESVAPFVLLFIPGFLGAIWTRETLRVGFRGAQRGDPPLTIAKDVGLFLLGVVFLIIVGLFSSSKRSGY